MATVYYPALIEPAGNGFSVYFPDLPGCTSAGDTEQEAALNAEDALAGHLIVSAEYGDDIPEPSTFGAVKAEPDEIKILVKAQRPGKAVRLNITLDEGLVQSIDRIAHNRSGFLADAARKHLRELAEA